MFANVRINYDLGEKLAVPEEAVMHTGTRDIVFLADAERLFHAEDGQARGKGPGLL